MISAKPHGRPIVRMWQNFNVAIFSDSINVINAKLCMMIVLIELCPFIPLSTTFVVFQGYSRVKQILRPLFLISAHVSWKNLNVACFSDIVKARYFKICTTITMLGVYIFIVALMTLTLFQGYRFVRIMNCKLCLLDSGLNVTCLLHALRRLRTIWIVRLRCVYKGDNLHVFGRFSVWVCWKL